jgi:hypothetical protein
MPTYADEEQLEIATRVNPLVTKYIGGRVLSFFSVSMVTCCLVLIGLTISSLVLYDPGISQLKEKHLSSAASLTYNSEFQAFLQRGINAKILIENGVPYESVFRAYPEVLSVTTVPDSSTTDYIRVTRKYNSTSVLIVDHSPNCVYSLTNVCDSEFLETDIRNSSWYSLGSAIDLKSSTGPIWSGPDAILNGHTNEISNTISLIWKDNSTFANSNDIAKQSNYRLTEIVLDVRKFELGYDQLLDGNGVERVWIIQRDTQKVVTALGVSEYMYMSVSMDHADSVTIELLDISRFYKSLTDGGWLSEIPRSTIFSYSVYIQQHADGISSATYNVDGTPFTILVASSSEPYYDTTFIALYIGELVFAVIPLLATLIVFVAYWLRLGAIRKIKQRRKLELLDAQQSMETVRRAKIDPSIVELTKTERKGLGLFRSHKKQPPVSSD